MGLNTELLRSSFNLVVEREPAITARFYGIFFDRYPQVVPMFSRNTPEKQQEMLTGALVAVLDHLEDAPWLASTLRTLGRRHEGYGVTAEMYDWVGECLLAAMAEVAGDDWSAEVEQAWVDAYGAIVSLTLND
ncbi:MAG: flavohemoprotein [Myxococcales bacterium]|nr:flavohemoprotein [Myxococcales bacterium]